MAFEDVGTHATLAPRVQWLEDRRVVGRKLWVEIHRLREADGLSVSALARRSGLDRKTVRRYLREARWRAYRRAALTDTLLAEHAGFLKERAPQVHYSAWPALS